MLKIEPLNGLNGRAIAAFLRAERTNPIETLRRE